MINAISLYRISRWLYLHHIPLIPKIIQCIIFLMYNSKIAPTCEIGRGTYCICGGLSVLIHFNAKIGDDCQIGSHACILGKTPYKNVPQIGNNVFIGHNSIVCGPVIVEDGAIIANGAVVMKSVPKNAIVAGIPAKIVGYKTDLGYDLIHQVELKEDIMPFLK